MELISKRIFGKYSKMKILGLKFLEKGHIFRPFSGIAPTKMKILSKNLGEQYRENIYNREGK